MTENKFEVLLFYKYVALANPKAVMDAQRKICSDLSIKGRIIVSKEGINGTIEGLDTDTSAYIDYMRNISEFSDINFKRSVGTGNAFPKLSVKVRDEIVTSFVDNLNPNVTTGKYLTASELHQWFTENEEFYIVDMRNDYEHLSGHFQDSILSGFHNFKDLPSIAAKIEHLRGKKIVTVCTGGVRCEKASGFLVTNGFSDVYQLKDGIQTYMEMYPNEHFKGKLYVFDGRITIGFNTDDPNHTIVGSCMLCGKKSDSYVNCMNHACHAHYICCSECIDVESGLPFCSDKCKQIGYAH